jgi:hypothetical protein
LGNGKKTNFRDDAWYTRNPLKHKFIGLFEICEQQHISVQEASNNHWNLRYRRWFDEDQQNHLVCMRNILLTYPLGEGEDKPVWNLNENKIFTMKSVFKKLTKNWRNINFKYLWKEKIPSKIKIWLRLIWHNAIASKDNMTKRGLIGDTKCTFCDEEENIHHNFFLCLVAKYMWSVLSLLVGAHTRPGNFTQYL